MSLRNDNLNREKLLVEYEDALFRLAMLDYAKEEGRSLQAEDEALGNNPMFQSTPQSMTKFQKSLDTAFRKKRFEHRQRKFPKTLNNVAAAIVVAVFVFSGVVITVQAARVEVLNFLISIQKEYTNIHLDGDGNNIVGNDILVPWDNAYVPTYLPDGYRVNRLINDPNVKIISYTNEQGNILTFSQYAATVSTNIDTENADDVQFVDINGMSGMLIRKDGRMTLTWSTNAFVFIIVAQVSEEEIMQIAENVRFIQ